MEISNLNIAMDLYGPLTKKELAWLGKSTVQVNDELCHVTYTKDYCVAARASTVFTVTRHSETERCVHPITYFYHDIEPDDKPRRVAQACQQKRWKLFYSGKARDLKTLVKMALAWYKKVPNKQVYDYPYLFIGHKTHFVSFGGTQAKKPFANLFLDMGFQRFLNHYLNLNYLQEALSIIKANDDLEISLSEPHSKQENSRMIRIQSGIYTAYIMPCINPDVPVGGQL